jgi:hypothetical protein
MNPNDFGRLLYLSSKLEMMVRGKPDDDQVAKIVVHVETQQQPRYANPTDIEREIFKPN